MNSHSSAAVSSRPSRPRRAKVIAMEKIKKIIEDEEEFEVSESIASESVAHAIVADKSSSEDNDIGSAHEHQTPRAPPTTPKHQPTKPASTNAPERIPKLTIQSPKLVCQGCIEEQPNQLAHVHPGGCLEIAFGLAADDHVDNNSSLGQASPKDQYDDEYKCPCYVEGCPGGCGTLWCGCIDVCRGRCGLRDYHDRWWR